MKWYGFKALSQKDKFINKLKTKKYFKNKKYLLFKNYSLNVNAYRINFYLPEQWDFFLLKKKNCKSNVHLFYFFSDFYYYFLPIDFTFTNLIYNNALNVLNFQFIYKSNCINLFLNNFKNSFYLTSKIFFKKIKFKGKGYYIYKNKRNTVALQFGYSHIKRLFFFLSSVKFLSKTSIMFFGMSPNELAKSTKRLFQTRPINIFTGKGMRFTRQIIYRKTGKISSYR